MVAKAERGGGEVEAAGHQPRRRRGFNKPSWLLCTIADLDERMKTFTRKVPRENSPSSDSFAARANSYYNERPQLLALLHDLYNGYLSLADRYCQAIAKGRHARGRHGSRCSSPTVVDEVKEDEGGEGVDSDAESSLSFQTPMVDPVKALDVDPDMVVAELVVKMVECDLVADELTAGEKRCAESSRKVELQKNLLDVLESERLILLNDNATLGYRVASLVEENKGLASESLFLKRKATELATCVLKAREDHRVCVLSRKIEDLQGQIHGLEKRNKEYYERLMKQGDHGKKLAGMKGGEEVSLEECFRARHGSSVGVAGLRKCFSFNGKNVSGGEVEGRRGGVKLWEKVKRFEYLLLCGPQFSANGKEGC